MTFYNDDFAGDIAHHEMHVIRDDGVHRHLRFKQPGSMCMHFDLITWPGYLCYTGDMGTYVFSRLLDMFEFFRARSEERRHSIDLRYWAEKLQASDRRDGVREWSADQFRAEVRDYFEQATEDPEDWPETLKAELWAEIEEQVCAAAEDSEHHAWVALCEFEHGRFRFQDWERDCKVWTHRFLWCCHALRWAIATYDASKVDAPINPALHTP
jgi:hypothetical protein